MRRTVAAVLVAVAVAHQPAAPRTLVAAPSTSAREDVLRACAGFSADDLRRLDHGEAISRSIVGHDRREIAVAGAVRMGVPAAFFTDRFRDITKFKRSSLVLQIGKFGDPPSLADLASLSLDPTDIEDIRDCRVGDCGLKLPVAAIERFRLEIGWAKPDAPRQAADLAKRMLLEQTLAYLDAGDPALAPYGDKRHPVSPSQEFQLLMPGMTCPGMPADALAYLTGFPHEKPMDVESFVYWSKESFGLKSLISTTHVLIFPATATRPAIIASKGLYTSHYVDASVSLTWLLDAGTDTHPAIDVVYMNRSRVDAFGGAFGRLAKSVATGRQRDGMVKELAALKIRVEGWLGS
jgi:hypothetical protein